MPPTPLPQRLADLLARDDIHGAVREYHELLRTEPDRDRLRVTFAELLAAHGWAEEAFQQVRRSLPRAEGEEGLLERCLAVLDSLELPAARELAASCRTGLADRRKRARRLLLAGTGLGLVLTLAAVLHGLGRDAKPGPELICREFPKGAPVNGLPERASQLELYRLVLETLDGRTVLDKPMAALTPQDLAALQERLTGLEGRAVLTNPPSISVNRWCVVEFAGGRVVKSESLSHAP
ncbi:MAG: hypothetical protein HY924_06115 [Elusimicrobia bacterium]|nr:hypothetical protein [Elusimicrobiota bacterium]